MSADVLSLRAAVPGPVLLSVGFWQRLRALQSVLFAVLSLVPHSTGTDTHGHLLRPLWILENIHVHLHRKFPFLLPPLGLKIEPKA